MHLHHPQFLLPHPDILLSVLGPSQLQHSIIAVIVEVHVKQLRDACVQLPIVPVQDIDIYLIVLLLKKDCHHLNQHQEQRCLQHYHPTLKYKQHQQRKVGTIIEVTRENENETDDNNTHAASAAASTSRKLNASLDHNWMRLKQLRLKLTHYLQHSMHCVEKIA